MLSSCTRGHSYSVVVSSCDGGGGTDCTWSLDSMSPIDIDAIDAACFSAETHTNAIQRKRRKFLEKKAMVGGLGACEVWNRTRRLMTASFPLDF